jgi:hypothetical protein
MPISGELLRDPVKISLVGKNFVLVGVFCHAAKHVSRGEFLSLYGDLNNRRSWNGLRANFFSNKGRVNTTFGALKGTECYSGH